MSKLDEIAAMKVLYDEEAAKLPALGERCREASTAFKEVQKKVIRLNQDMEVLFGEYLGEATYNV